jgi:acetyl esterase/lipase
MDPGESRDPDLDLTGRPLSPAYTLFDPNVQSAAAVELPRRRAASDLPRKFALGVSIMLAALLSACSPLRTFNSIVPKDGGGERIARAEAYGQHPRQRLDLYGPKVRGRGDDRPLPIIVFFYGGSWQTGMREGYGFVGRALASSGFLVAIADYRLVPEVRFPAFLEDSGAAVRWVRANAARFGGDPSRIVLVGHSAGAYNAAMTALDPQWLGSDRQAVRGLVGLAGPYDFLPFDIAVSRAAFGAAPDPAATQPINFASAGDPPALLLHGAKDTTVLPRNSHELARRLRAAGVEARVKLYPELGHVGMITAFARPLRGRAPVLQDVVQFAREVTDAPQAD